MDDNQRGHLYAHWGIAGVEHAEVLKSLVEMAMQSQADLAIIPMQDILELDGSHRMNTPGTASGNWHWRFNWQQLTQAHKVFFSTLIKDTKRAGLVKH
jgi:4-alpha-glucanotransferase